MMVEGEEGEQELELPPIRQGEVGYYDLASITVKGEGGGRGGA
jgi:hypothetical protein